jgi:drug/metabolite transporter (DMT)-like permease
VVTALALAAAFAFAVGNVLQQLGTMQTDAGEDDPRFLVQMFRRPVWLAGALCQASGWILQAIALDKGPLAQVQSITTLSLVIALPLGARYTGQRVTRPVVLGAIAVVVGVVVFIAVGTPESGTSTPAASVAIGATLVTVVLTALFAAFGARRTGGMRATLFGTAAGFAFGLQGAATKVFVGVVPDGFGAVLSSFSTWLLVLSALLGLAFQQGALKTGVLAPAMASSNAVTLLVSVVLGAAVFDEMVGTDALTRFVAWVGIAVAVTGVVVLAARSESPTTLPTVAAEP